MVKVSETVAETLVAKIIIEAIRESAHRLSMLQHSSEESEEEDSSHMDHSRCGLEPMFVNTNETFYCLLNESVTFTARLKNNEFNSVQWYKEDIKLKNDE